MRPDQILQGLNPEQAEAATADPGPLLITAGAGTGKTRTVTARIAYRIATGELPAGAILAVTHSTRAAGQLRGSLATYRVPGAHLVATRTIHAAALNQLRYFWADLRRPGTDPQVCSDQLATVRAVARHVAPNLTGGHVVGLVQEISWAKSRLVSPDDYARVATGAARRTPIPLDMVARIYDRYEHALRARNLLDHTDLLTAANAAIREHPHVADAVHRRARFVVVDEYQDVDPAQQQLIDAWSGSGADLTVVGDPRQAIYSFKGADPALLASFTSRYEAAKHVDLRVNYRSTPQIVAAANSLAQHLGGMTAAAAPLEAASRPGPSPLVRSFPTDGDEEQWVAAQIAGQIAAGDKAGQIGVLVRDNARARTLTAALETRAIPVWLSGGVRFFDRPEVRAVLSQMRDALEQGSQLSGAGLLREVLRDCGFDPNRAPAPTSAAAPVWRSRAALLEWVQAMPAVELLAAEHLVSELERAGADGHQVGLDAVFVGTVHAAKGLEFDAVFTLGWDSSWGAQDQGGNLAYVALTRARKFLALTWATSRAATPSVLVGAAGLGADAPAPRAQGRRARSGVCRRCRRPLPEGAQSLEACAFHLTGQAARDWSTLIAWRGEQGVIRGVHPSRILTDSAVLAIVAARPRNVDELAAVPGVGNATLSRFAGDIITAVTHS